MFTKISQIIDTIREECQIIRTENKEGSLKYSSVNKLGELKSHETCIINFPFESDYSLNIYEDLILSSLATGNSKINESVLKKLFAVNNSFDLRLYLPSKDTIDITEDKKFTNIFLMFNGFADTDVTTFDHLGTELSSKGMPCLLVPLAFHLVRHFTNLDIRCDFDKYRYPEFEESKELLTTQLMAQFIFQTLYGIPHLLDICLHQHSSDVNSIIEQIQSKRNKNSLINKICNDQTKIHLLGYSLGGLQALHIARAELKKKVVPRNIDKVILLESGASLDQIRVNKLLTRNKRITDKLYEFYVKEDGQKSRGVRMFRFQSFFHKTLESNKIKLFNKYFTYSNESEIYSNVSFRSTVTNEEINELVKVKDYYSLKDSQKVELQKEMFFKLLRRDEFESNELWRGLLKILYQNNQDKGEHVVKNEIDRYEKTFFSDDRILRDEELQRLSEHLLIILGGSDDIFPLHLINNISPEDGLAVVNIPGLSHFIRTKRSLVSWNYWRTFLADVILALIKTKR